MTILLGTTTQSTAFKPRSNNTAPLKLHQVESTSTFASASTASSSASSVGSETSSVPPPLLGFGTFNEFKDHDKVEVAVRDALQVGYKLIDCASLYGNEASVGRAIAASINEAVVDRDSVFVCSKLWCSDAAPEHVERACKRTLSDLHLEYLDNYMLHWPCQWTSTSKLVSTEYGGKFDFELVHDGSDYRDIMPTYHAMENLVDKGLIRSIGLSNVGIKTLRGILSECRITPQIVEVEMHPYLAQPRLLEFCEDNDIHVVAYSPLGKVGYRNKGDPSLLEDEVVMSIAEETGRSPGQVLLRWGVQRGVTVIPKSLRRARIEMNQDIFDWKLTKSQMERLDALDRGFRFVRPPWYDFKCDSEYVLNDEEAMIPLAASHPPGQPMLTRCEANQHGGFVNMFERDGKKLRSEIVIQDGIVANLKDFVTEVLPENSLEAANHLVTDEIVNNLYGSMVLDGLRASGIQVELHVIPAATTDEDCGGESSTEPFKTSETFHNLVDAILESGISKHSCIISLGGGVVNNICGVIAATLYRGISLVHFTTTSMGMLDAAIDFKQAFNHHCGKNLLGSYYPASKIIMDPHVLCSLSNRHMLNGIAEAIKHALYQSSELVYAIAEPLRANSDNIDATLRNRGYLMEILKATIEVKIPTLNHYDESDFNEAAPQAGHVVGHAVEFASWKNKAVDPLLHGEAVAVGLCVTAEIAHLVGVCSEEVVERTYDSIRAATLPCFVPEGLEIEGILETMKYDKHFVGQPSMGLPADIGAMAYNVLDKSFFFSIPMETVRKGLELNIGKRTLN